jgi:hypothetical protein
MICEVGSLADEGALFGRVCWGGEEYDEREASAWEEAQYLRCGGGAWFGRYFPAPSTTGINLVQQRFFRDPRRSDGLLENKPAGTFTANIFRGCILSYRGTTKDFSV